MSIELAYNKMPAHWSHVYGATSISDDTYVIMRDGRPVVGAVYPKYPTNEVALPGVHQQPIRATEAVSTNWVKVEKKVKYPKHAFVD